MIRLAASILVRALVELGLVLLLFGAVFFVVAFRTARRFATPTPDKLDRMSSELARLLTIGLVAGRTARENVVTSDTRGDEPELDYLGDIDWRQVVV